MTVRSSDLRRRARDARPTVRAFAFLERPKDGSLQIAISTMPGEGSRVVIVATRGRHESRINLSPREFASVELAIAEARATDWPPRAAEKERSK